MPSQHSSPLYPADEVWVAGPSEITVPRVFSTEGSTRRSRMAQIAHERRYGLTGPEAHPIPHTRTWVR
jgi:hypothetical protein